MNRPCRIHFHEDCSPVVSELPERYHDYVERTTRQGATKIALLVQNAFYIDVASHILRTRVGEKRTDPIDFPVESISHIEWFFGETPSPLVPYTGPIRAGQTNDNYEAN